MSVRVWSPGVTARMLRRRPGAALLMSALAIVLTIGAVGIPGVLRSLGDRIAREAVAQLAPGSRDLEASAIGLPQVAPATGADVDLPPAVAEQWGAFDSGLEAARAAQKPPLAPIMGHAEYVVRTPEAPLVGRRTQSVTYLLDPRLTEHAEITEGAWPAPPKTSFEPGPFGVTVSTMEIALSSDTAHELGWRVGEERDVQTAFPSSI